MSAKVFNVLKGSPAYKAGIRKGDTVISINGNPIVDYLDYMYHSSAENLTIELCDKTVDIKNSDYMPLGIEFESLLIDEPMSCRNKCIFCFIDQLPSCMRESCYFKDDDYRLSFLQGNYVTLTNLSDTELKRIVDYNIPRINISVHTTNPNLRIKMLNNRFAGKILEQIKLLSESGLSMNCQIVLCKGINDGAELEKTLDDLFLFSDSIESVSVVPVGLSDYRNGLFELEPFGKEDSLEVIKLCHRLQKKYKEKTGTNFVYLSDEFYIMAETDFPKFDDYFGFPQIENGVGLCASLLEEFNDAVNMSDDYTIKTEKCIVTGELSFDFICSLVKMLNTDKIKVYKIRNNFFGEKITVSGLLVGKDIVEQLNNKSIPKKMIITNSMLRHDEDVFLDNMTVSDVEKALNVQIKAVNNDGFELFDALID